MTLELVVTAAIDMPSSPDLKFNEAALEKLFKECFKPLCAYCQYRFGFELDVAKEAVHMGFIRLWENRHTLSCDLSVKAYLYKIITNISLDMIRHEQVKQQHARQVLQNTPINRHARDFNSSDLKQLSSEIDRAVAELPDQMRRIFELSRYEGLKYAAIATELNISVKTVETQMSRALVKLRQKLSHYLLVSIMLIVTAIV